MDRNYPSRRAPDPEARPPGALQARGARTSRRGIYAPTRAGPMAFARHTGSNAGMAVGLRVGGGRVRSTVGGRLEALAVRRPHVVELVEEGSRPGGDVVLLDGAAHRPHPALPVLRLGPVGL